MKAGLLHKLGSGLALGLCVFISGCGKEEKNNAVASGSSEAVRRNPAGIYRVQWNFNTLVEPYLKKGHRDPSWDESATNALIKFAFFRSDKSFGESDRYVLASYCRDALSKGCSDPMIVYLHARFVLAYQEDMTDAILGEAYKKASSQLRKYPLAPVRQFYLALRASEAINAATGGKAASPEVHGFRRAAMSSLFSTLQDPDIPPTEAYDACRDMLAGLNRNPVITEFYGRLEPVLLKNWPNESFVYVIQAGFHIDEAWRARGSGYADKVTSEGWKRFASHLDLAAEALEKAWKLDPTNTDIPYRMMSVELGQGKGRDRLDLWFNRAMAIASNNVAACKSKLYYLEPKWHGSEKEMLEFARECAASKEWAGEVLLMPLFAHDTLSSYAKRDGDTNYWKRPVVWAEIKSTLDQFFTRYPDATGWRHNYAWYAYYAGRWDEFNRQISLFSTGTNYQTFGGREAFDLMVKTAQDRASKTARN